MFSTRFNFTPNDAYFNFSQARYLTNPFLDNPLLNPQLISNYTEQTRKLIDMQMAFADLATFGLVSDIKEEIEHTMVEGVEIAQVLVEKLHTVHHQELSEEKKHALSKDAFTYAQNKFTLLTREFFTTLWTLPFNRAAAKPARKRFPITIDGEVIKNDQ